MRIGVDASCWANRRGYGRFAREIISSMATIAPDDEFVCFLDPLSASTFDLRSANVRIVNVALRESPTEAASADGSRSIMDVLRMSRAVWREQLDVFFFPSVYTWFPVSPTLPTVVTIHDAIPERFPALTLPLPRARALWRLKTRLATRQAKRILTVSEYAANEVARAHNVPRSRIAVAVEAPAAAYTGKRDDAAIAEEARRHGLADGDRWFIYVGGFNPHKNLPALIRAHAALAREFADHPPLLLLVGTVSGDVFHHEQESIRRMIRDSGTETLVRWTGYVDDEKLRHLQAGAIALVLPSESEGFGLPAVEAAATGTPVIATSESPLPRLLDGGGIFVRPGDEPGLLAAMRLMLLDETTRSAMGRQARVRAAALTWPDSAKSALAAIREAAR
ncbi:MAG: glycosyltransferase family 4 protein [Gemmatimonadaceae bacterium]|nr:glycosyltransferase family 4 protein [Gemmatimonadaceae bacterium]